MATEEWIQESLARLESLEEERKKHEDALETTSDPAELQQQPGMGVQPQQARPATLSGREHHAAVQLRNRTEAQIGGEDVAHAPAGPAGPLPG